MNFTCKFGKFLIAEIFFYNFTNFPQYGGAIGKLARVATLGWEDNNGTTSF